MTRLAELPPDQRAAVSLLLRGNRTHEEVASLLGLPATSVHDRAHAALALLAPDTARRCTAAQREQIGEYLLGQQDPAARSQTIALLAGSEDARAWASAVAAELGGLGAISLPEIPFAGHQAPVPSAPGTPIAGGQTTVPPEPATPPAGVTGPATASAPNAGQRGGAPSISRRGGAVLLGVIAIVVVVAVVLIVNSGSGKSPASSTSTSTTAATGKAAKSATKTATAKPKFDKQLNLSSPQSNSKAVGIVEILSEGSEHAFYIVAEDLPPSAGDTYVAWLYNSSSEAVALGSGPTVGSNGRLGAIGALPSDAGHYRHLILTRETTKHPIHPGPIVLEGTFSL